MRTLDVFVPYLFYLSTATTTQNAPHKRVFVFLLFKKTGFTLILVLASEKFPLRCRNDVVDNLEVDPNTYKRRILTFDIDLTSFRCRFRRIKKDNASTSKKKFLTSDSPPLILCISLVIALISKLSAVRSCSLSGYTSFVHSGSVRLNSSWKNT